VCAIDASSLHSGDNVFRSLSEEMLLTCTSH